MVGTITRSLASLCRSVPDWVRPALRFGVAALVARPAVSKFATYGESVAFFARIGVPAPTAAVAASGVVEVASVALLVLGVGERLAALALVPVMLVAIAYVGPGWKNLAVLGGSLAVVLLWTGADAASPQPDRPSG